MGLEIEEKIIVEFERAAQLCLIEPFMAAGKCIACSPLIGGLACVSLALSYVARESNINV